MQQRRTLPLRPGEPYAAGHTQTFVKRFGLNLCSSDLNIWHNGSKRWDRLSGQEMDLFIVRLFTKAFLGSCVAHEVMFTQFGHEYPLAVQGFREARSMEKL